MIYVYVFLLYFFVNISAQPLDFLRDPFMEITDLSLFESTQVVSADVVIFLKGVIWDDISPAAVVEISKTKKVVYVGDSMGAYEVVKIEKNYIQFKGQDQLFMLKLGEEHRP